MFAMNSHRYNRRVNVSQTMLLRDIQPFNSLTTYATQSPRTAPPELSGELHDMIIDHLYDNNRALTICARVCKAWIPSSRHHLLSTITIYQNDTVDTFGCLLDRPNQEEWADQVRKIIVGPIDFRSSRTIVPGAILELIKALPPLSNIKELILTDLDRSMLRGTMLRWVLDLLRCSTLRSLTVNRIQVGSFQDVLNMVRLASNVKRLIIGYINVPREEMMPSQDIKPHSSSMPKLEEFTLSSPNNVHIIPQLLYPSGNPTDSAGLTRFTVSLNLLLPTQWQSSTTRFLESISDTLEDLTFSLSLSKHVLPGALKQLKLKPKTALKTIKFDILDLDDRNDQLLMKWITSFLEYIAAPNLKTVNFRFRMMTQRGSIENLWPFRDVMESEKFNGPFRGVKPIMRIALIGGTSLQKFRMKDEFEGFFLYLHKARRLEVFDGDFWSA